MKRLLLTNLVFLAGFVAMYSNNLANPLDEIKFDETSNGNGPIKYDESIQDAIQIPGEIKEYTFNGTTGDRVTVFLDNRASNYLSLRLTKPDGSSWYCDFSYFDCQIDNVALPLTGVYTITVDGRGDATGNYTLVLNLLGDKETINYNEPLDRDIGLMGDQDGFIFTGTAGQRVTAFLDNRASDYLSLRLIKPDGSSWFCDFSYFDCQIDNVMLPVSGEYLLTVDGREDAMGNYTIVMNLLGDNEAIVYDQPIDHDLSPMGDQDGFTFKGTAGQRVTAFLDNRASDYLSLRLTEPDGSSWFCDFSYFDCQIDNVTLPADGAYLLTVDGREDATGSYTIIINLLGDQEDLPCRQSMSRSIHPAGDQDEFTFYGEPGQRVTVLLDNRASDYLSLRLTRPNGSSWFCDFSYFDCQIDNVTLPDSGKYIITVDGRDDAMGNYSVFLTCHSITSVEATKDAVPAAYELGQNYPNPFNPSTVIPFSLPFTSHVTLKIFDLVGREIVTLVNEKLAAGRYETHWNGSGVESGMYFYQLRAGEFVATQKLILMK